MWTSNVTIIVQWNHLNTIYFVWKSGVYSIPEVIFISRYLPFNLHTYSNLQSVQICRSLDFYGFTAIIEGVNAKGFYFII